MLLEVGEELSGCDNASLELLQLLLESDESSSIREVTATGLLANPSTFAVRNTASDGALEKIWTGVLGAVVLDSFTCFPTR